MGSGPPSEDMISASRHALRRYEKRSNRSLSALQMGHFKGGCGRAQR